MSEFILPKKKISKKEKLPIIAELIKTNISNDNKTKSSLKKVSNNKKLIKKNIINENDTQHINELLEKTKSINIPYLELKLILDNRECGLIDKLNNNIISSFEEIKQATLEIHQLPLGDIIIGYSIEKPLVIIERKSFSDLFASLKDGRYNEQSFRLQHSSNIHCHNIIYLLEGTITSLNEDKRKLLYSCITSIQLFKGFSVIRSSSLDETANILLSMMDKIKRDLKKGKVLHNTYIPLVNECVDENIENIKIENELLENKIINETYLTVGINKQKGKNIVPENIGAIILSQIPGINYITSEIIMKKYDNSFKSFYSALIESNGEILNGLKNENGRKISKTAILNIIKYIL